MLPPKIFTDHAYPPTLQRGVAWCAYRDGYKPGRPTGWGRTEQEAIDELLRLEQDEADYAQWCEDESRRDDARQGWDE